MEACGSAHYWGRELSGLGHDPRLMPAAYVKAYLKRGKNDARDAEASCEAVCRPTMRRSEEHTSELQSLMRISYAVFCLKKKIQEQNVACDRYRLLPDKQNTTN